MPRFSHSLLTTTVVICHLILLMVTPAHSAPSDSTASEVSEGLDAYNSGNHQRAKELFTRAANSNNPEAMYYLGRMHITGDGKLKTDYKAFKLIKQSAESKFAESEYFLGLMYLKGTGTDTSRKEAMQWFERAAKQGHPEAQYKAAELSKVDKGKKRFWYEKAAQNNHQEAQIKLGSLLLFIAKNQEDRIESYYWLKVASAQGHDKARSPMKSAAEYLTSEEIVLADEQAEAWISLQQE